MSSRALEFFDALPSRPLAWDRWFALRLVVQAFINTAFGYRIGERRGSHARRRSFDSPPEGGGNLAFLAEHKLGLATIRSRSSSSGSLPNRRPKVT